MSTWYSPANVRSETSFGAVSSRQGGSSSSQRVQRPSQVYVAGRCPRQLQQPAGFAVPISGAR